MRVWHVLTVRGAVHCLHAQRKGGKELLGLRLVVALLKKEHRYDKPGGGLAIGANCGRLASSISQRGGAVQAAALRLREGVPRPVTAGPRSGAPPRA